MVVIHFSVTAMYLAMLSNTFYVMSDFSSASLSEHNKTCSVCTQINQLKELKVLPCKIILILKFSSTPKHTHEW